MKGLLIVLTVVALMAALFLGGCAIAGILDNASLAMRNPGEVMYGGLSRGIVVMSVFGLLLAASLLVANVLVLRSLVRGTTRRRRLVARLLAVFDGVAAAAALAWLVWADTWHGVEWPWTWLTKAATVVLAIKGGLVWRLVGRAVGGDTVQVGKS